MSVPPPYQPKPGGSNIPSSSGMNHPADGHLPFEPLQQPQLPPSSLPPHQNYPVQRPNQSNRQPPPPPPPPPPHMPVQRPPYMPTVQHTTSINDINPNTPLYQLLETTKTDPEYNREVADTECSALIEFGLDAFFYAIPLPGSTKLVIPDKQTLREKLDAQYARDPMMKPDVYVKQEPKVAQMSQQQLLARQQQARQQFAQTQMQQQQQRQPVRPMHPQMAQSIGSGGFYVTNPSTSSAYPNWQANGAPPAPGAPQGNGPVRPMMQPVRHAGPYPVHVQHPGQAVRSPYYPPDQPGSSNGHQPPPPGYQNQSMVSPAYAQVMNAHNGPSSAASTSGFSRQSSFQDPYNRAPASMVAPQSMVKQEVLSRPGSSSETGAMKHSPADLNSSAAMSNGSMRHVDPNNSGDSMQNAMFSSKNGLRQPQMMPPRNSPQVRGDMMSPPVHMTKNGLMSPHLIADPQQQSPMQANGIEAVRHNGPQNVSPLVGATPPNNNESPNCPKLLAALSKSGDSAMNSTGSPAGETLLAANPRKRASDDEKQKPKRAKLDGTNMPYKNMCHFILQYVQNQPRSLLRHICELLLEPVKASKRALEWKDDQQRVFSVSKPRVFSDRWKAHLGETDSKNITYTKMEAELLKTVFNVGNYPVLMKVAGSTREFQFFPGFNETEHLRVNHTILNVDMQNNKLIECPINPHSQQPMMQVPSHQMPPHQQHQMMYQGGPPPNGMPPNGNVMGGPPPPNGTGGNVRYMMQQPSQPPPQHFAPAPIKTA